MILHLAQDVWVERLSNTNQPLVFPLFGFDTVAPDWGFHDRVLDDHLMYLVVEGHIRAQIAGSSVNLLAGSFLWMQPGVAHTFLRATSDELSVYFVRFRLDPPDRLVAAEGPAHRQLDDAWELRPLFDELIDELGTRLIFRDFRLRGLLVAIVTAALRRRFTEPPRPIGTLSRAQRKVIEQLVRDDPALRMTPAQLARAVQLSPDYFARLFTTTFGAPPRTWLANERLLRTARALSDSVASISQIASAHGYKDITAFSHQFKRRYGVGPRAFRQQQRVPDGRQP